MNSASELKFTQTAYAELSAHANNLQKEYNLQAMYIRQLEQFNDSIIKENKSLMDLSDRLLGKLPENIPEKRPEVKKVIPFRPTYASAK